MCLCTVTYAAQMTDPSFGRQVSTGKKKYKVGWKWFKKGVKTGTLYTPFRCTPCAVNRWIEDSNTNYNSIPFYYMGFHIYKIRQAARNYKTIHPATLERATLKKVRYQHVLAEGNQGGHKVVVARQMFIEHQVNKVSKVSKNKKILRKT